MISYQLVFTPADAGAPNAQTMAAPFQFPSFPSTPNGSLTILGPQSVELIGTATPDSSLARGNLPELAFFQIGSAPGFGDDSGWYDITPITASCAKTLTFDATPLNDQTLYGQGPALQAGSTYYFRFAESASAFGCFDGLNQTPDDGGSCLNVGGGPASGPIDGVPVGVEIPEQPVPYIPPSLPGPTITFTMPAAAPSSVLTGSVLSGVLSTDTSCPTSHSSCQVTYDLDGVESLGATDDARGLSKNTRPHTRLVVLATSHTMIPAGHKELLHLHLTKAGRRFLKAHPHAPLVAKVTSRAGHGHRVTTTTAVHLAR